jgi:hypothetical protein
MPTATTTSGLRHGITACSWYASLATRVGHELIAVGMLILVGGGAVGRLTMLSWSGGRVLVYGGGAGSANTN